MTPTPLDQEELSRRTWARLAESDVVETVMAHFGAQRAKLMTAIYEERHESSPDEDKIRVLKKAAAELSTERNRVERLPFAELKEFHDQL